MAISLIKSITNFMNSKSSINNPNTNTNVKAKKKSFILPILLLIIVFGTILFGAQLPLDARQFFYSVSLTINGLLVFLMPLIIFCLLFSSLLKLSGQVLWLVLLLFPAICCSNFITTNIAYFSGSMVITKFAMLTSVPELTQQLAPLWKITFPKLMSNQHAIVLALFFALVSIIVVKVRPKLSYAKIAELLNSLATLILKRLIVPLLPLFVFGFLLKLQYEGMLTVIVNKYGLVFASIFATQISYVALLFAVANKFNIRNWCLSIKNLFSAVLVGFTTMSSMAALPLSLAAAIKNTKAEEIPKLVIPTTVNVHLVGDCIAIPTFALAILYSFGFGLPDYTTYLIFAGYFIIAKFAVAAVPAGGVIVMVPILEQYLGFTSDMSSLITALYILFDCIITSTNVFGNGAFVMIFNDVVNQVKKLLPSIAGTASLSHIHR